MAVVKLGAIITQIAGSIGGWTFRRSQGSTVVYNKPAGASKNRLLLNSALSVLRSVIQGWILLSIQVRADWAQAAPLFLFPDKFGDLRALNGRSLYIKLTASANSAGDPSPDPTTLDSTIALNPIISAVIVNGGSKNVGYNNSGAGIRYLIQAERLKNVAISPTFNRRKILFAGVIPFGTVIPYTAEFDAAFPNITVGEHFNVYSTPQNIDGFRAVTEVKLVQVV